MLTALFAQEATQLNQLHLVGQPERSESELVSASTKDVNGRTCSAIKVLSDLEGFSYDSYNGVVKVDDQPGQDMVYLSPDERVLQIFHTGYEPLKLILSNIGISLEERRVWSIRMTGDKKTTEVAVNILTEPTDVEIYLDGVKLTGGEKQLVAAGRHELRLLKMGYQTIEESIQVDEKSTLFRYQLKKVEDIAIFIESEPSGATVYLDGVKLGTTPSSYFYPPGHYKLWLEMDWYISHEEELEIAAPETRRKVKLQENFACLSVTSAPESGLDLYMNGLPQQYRTPYTFERLAPGSYRVKARSTLYETDEQELILDAGDRKTVTLSSSAGYATLTIRTKPGATVYLNDKKLEQLENIRLEPSMILLRAEMKKAKPAEQRLTLRKGESRIIDLMPVLPTGTIQVAVTPFDAQVELRGDGGENYSSIGAKIFVDIPTGNYRLKVSQVGYPDKEETLQLKEGEKLTRSVTLVKTESSSKQPEVVSPVRPKVTDTAWRDSKTGIEFVLVKGGTFDMGDTFGAGDKNEKPVHSVTVRDFYLGKTEVTVGQFRQFVDATGYRTDAEKEGWAYVWTGSTWEKVDGAGWKKPGFTQDDNHPVVCVSWNDATAFCKWAGYRLPTEAEWEYAARERGRKKRFGNGKDVADPSEINFDGRAKYKKSYSIVGVYRKRTTQVGRFAPNALGLLDMTGNVWEWCQDWYGADYYANSSSINPQGPVSGTHRVLRGGSWVIKPSGCRATFRNGNYYPVDRDSSDGFRVARPLQ